MKLTAKAYAKLNLTLDVLGILPNGYHNIETIFQSVSLCDIVTMENGKRETSVFCSGEGMPQNNDNICYLAATLFLKKAGIRDGIAIEINKQIPVAAGLGGGSADAAAVIVMMNEIYHHILKPNELRSISASVGADVPFCTIGGTSLATGIGENLRPLESLPECDIVLIKHGTKPSTAELYKKLDSTSYTHPDTAAAILALESGDITLLSKYIDNCFSYAWGDEVSHTKEMLLQQGALTAELSGSGPTVFGVYPCGKGKAAAEEIKKEYPNTFLCHPKNLGVEIISKDV